MAREKPVSLSREALPESLFPDSSFSFRCHPGLACFNQCCLAPTVVLSPYDIWRLQDGLGISSGELLERYTLRHPEERSNLPLVFVDAFSSPKGCPFLTPGGCGVYPHRPGACRLFPVTMGSQLTPQGVVDHYFCRRLDYCQGFNDGPRWTLESWKADQNFAGEEQDRRAWFELILRQALAGPLPATPGAQDLFFTLAYDLDGLRRLLSEPSFLQAAGLEAAPETYLALDDPELLRFSCRYLKAALAGEGGGLPAVAQRIAAGPRGAGRPG